MSEGSQGGGAPRVAAVGVALPANVYPQAEVVAAFADASMTSGPRRQLLDRFAVNAGVRTRHMTLPLEDYAELGGFTEANDHFIAAAQELGETAIGRALESAGLRAGDVDIIATTTVTGLAVPSLDALLARRLGLREDVKRLPMFGLGCAGGAAGVARVSDYLRGCPGKVAVLVAVELCSLTFQRETSTANLVSASLFGDGAAAVVLTGPGRVLGPGPEVIASRSRLYPDSEHVMGWRIGAHGFQIVLSADTTSVVERYLGEDIRRFLGDHGLMVPEMAAWVCHPGGPKVMDALQAVCGLPDEALARSRGSLARVGNLSSASVLDVLRDTLAAPPPGPCHGLMTAIGPGFGAELVLLRWPQ